MPHTAAPADRERGMSYDKKRISGPCIRCCTGAQPRRGRVSAGGKRSAGKPGAVCGKTPRAGAVGRARAHVRARALFAVPRGVGGRRGQGAGEPRLPRAVQLCHWPVQGRLALSPQCECVRHQIPGLRAGVQKQPHRPAHGRRQGRLGF